MEWGGDNGICTIEQNDRKVVPDGAANFAFIGQFAETPRGTDIELLLKESGLIE